MLTSVPREQSRAICPLNGERAKHSAYVKSGLTKRHDHKYSNYFTVDYLQKSVNSVLFSGPLHP